MYSSRLLSFTKEQEMQRSLNKLFDLFYYYMITLYFFFSFLVVEKEKSRKLVVRKA